MKKVRASKLMQGFVLVCLLAGCSRSCPASDATSSSETSAATAKDRADRLDGALSSAADYLVAAQSPDGAWRSDVYAAFKEGDALTPLVLQALVEMPATDRTHTAVEKGIQYLIAMTRDDGSLVPPPNGLTYPVYTASGAVIVLSRQDDARSRAAAGAWLKALRSQQLAEDLGWQPSDPEFGGWGYAKVLPAKPKGEQPVGPLAEPNLSATVAALEALRAVGVPTSDSAVQRALAFLKRCQNLPESGPHDERFDDGGFFFIQDDPARNKAGPLGTDPSGRVRFASYGSATADGLRALRLCGLADDSPRVIAANRWLEKHFSATTHPGEYLKNREGTRQALYFYYCRSLARALSSAPMPQPSPAGSSWADELSDGLINRQRSDGSWVNSVVDVREDDPILATSLAAMALATCRDQHFRSEIGPR